MKKFTLHTADKRRSFSLNTDKALATEPTGLGNNFAVSYKETMTRKYMTNVKPDFEAIKTKIYFNADGSFGYGNYKEFLSFLGACGGGSFLFEYYDGVTKKMCDVVLTSAPKSEINEDGVFAEDFTFDRLSYWYEEVNQSFALKSVDNTAVSFPLNFPFRFRGKIFINTFDVKNEFYEDAPVIIKITGNIANKLKIFVADKATGDLVSEINLSTNSKDGTTIIIDATAKKISVDNGTTVENGYGLTDKTKQSFLYLPNGEYTIGANITQDDNGEISVSVKRYLLD